MRFIVESDSTGHWACHQEGRPELSASGMTAAHAFERCCAIYRVDPADFRSAVAGKGGVFTPLISCPDCGGSGRYVGLNIAEPCGTCGGTGSV